MRYRWVLSPVVLHVPEDGDAPIRKPKAATLIDPARGKTYMHTSVIGTENWCLSLVAGEDFGPLLADKEIIDIFEQDGGPELLALTPSDLGWRRSDTIRLSNRLGARGQDISVGLDTPLGELIGELAGKISAKQDVRKLGVSRGRLS